MKILIIDDDPIIAAIVRVVLASVGDTVDHAEDGTIGIRMAFEGEYDGILLDLGLGDRTGVSVLQELRSRGLATPVMVLTAERSEDAMVRVLDSGADEYLIKPVMPEELKARVRALTRRRRPPAAETDLVTGSMTLKRIERQVFVRGVPMNLAPREFELLKNLMIFAGRVVKRDFLAEEIWQSPTMGKSNVMDVHVRRLRHKLALADAPARIETQRGVGFCLVPEDADPGVTVAHFA